MNAAQINRILFTRRLLALRLLVDAHKPATAAKQKETK